MEQLLIMLVENKLSVERIRKITYSYFFTSGFGSVFYGLGGGDGINSETLTCYGTFDSIIIQSGGYKSVVRFDDTYQYAERKNRTQVYIAKNIGIVKKVLLDSNHTWLLEKYNIVQ
ncbi:MAG: hypothetical protein JNL63_02155 [Bacteroidia bacterium]|nr:hypothetical protein [Bacteroidia bacterium]